MTDQNAIATQDDAKLMESVLLQGDLSKLTPSQRVNYYKRVCESLGLNPLTRPFDYITLNNRLTLYAKKDAADQLRKIHGVSIDDVDIQELADMFVVKVKGHDRTGRSDVEIGVVKKSDMQGNLANVQMKASTKAKRRLTLSLCGLGWLDETEVEAVPNAEPITVTEEGEIETPIVKGIRLYAELCEKAKTLGIPYEPLPEKVTLDYCRAMYSDLFGFVKEAEAQARQKENQSE